MSLNTVGFFKQKEALHKKNFENYVNLFTMNLKNYELKQCMDDAFFLQEEERRKEARLKRMRIRFNYTSRKRRAKKRLLTHMLQPRKIEATLQHVSRNLIATDVFALPAKQNENARYQRHNTYDDSGNGHPGYQG
ncbi:MAG: hypothetical protein WC785_04215 [Tatlockia sp.]|jgi:hypothetical protein